MSRGDGLEGLQRAGTEAHGLVVAERGVVVVAGFLQSRWSVLIEEQPVHTDTGRGHAGYFGHGVALLGAPVRVDPGVDTVDADLAARGDQVRDPLRNVRRAVRRSPDPRCGPTRRLAWITLARQDEE